MDTRWWILICCCIQSFATDLFYEEPSILVQRLTGTADSCKNGADSCLDFSLYQFNLIFSSVAWASALAAIVAGLIIDQHGCKYALWFSSFCLFTGPLLFAGGSYCSTNSSAFGVMLTGRLIFGLGSGSVIVITHRIKASWYFYRELGLAFSLHLLTGRLGSATSFLLFGGLVESLGLTQCLWIGFAVNIFTTVSCMFLAELHVRGSLLLNSPTNGNGHGIWKFLTSLDRMYWCFVVVGVCFYGSVSTFAANGPNFIAAQYGYSEATASYIVGLIYDISLLVPLVGWLMDQYGFREYWILESSCFLFLAFLFVLVIPSFPAWLLPTLIGIGYMGFGPMLWSSTPLIVLPDSVGRAYGLLKFFNYIGTGVFTASAGQILNMPDDSKTPPWASFFILLVLISIICVGVSIAIIIVNRLTGSRLTPSQKERDRKNGLQEITPLRTEHKNSFYSHFGSQQNVGQDKGINDLNG